MVDEGGELRALVQAQPIAALGTLHAGDDGIEPFVSMVPVAWRPASAQALIHVSRLAPHTRDLLAASRVSLMLVAPRQPGDNPLALARLSLQPRSGSYPVAGSPGGGGGGPTTGAIRSLM